MGAPGMNSRDDYHLAQLKRDRTTRQLSAVAGRPDPLPWSTAGDQKRADLARLASVVELLSVMADADRLLVLLRLGERAREIGELVQDVPPAVVESLHQAGLVHGNLDAVRALTPRGRQAWIAVRGLL
jgi:hypothetical protein